MLPIVEFAYNNAKNTSTRHTLFKLTCGYQSKIFFEEDVDLRSRSRSDKKLVKELGELIKVCYQNLLHAQKPEKRAHNKGVKSHSYFLGEKV